MDEAGAGLPVEPPDGCAATLVAADVALVEPWRLTATTLNRNVEPASTEATVWVVPVASLMGAQLPPLLSHRSH